MRTRAPPVLLSPATDQNSTAGRAADGLYGFLKAGPDCSKKGAPKPCVPYDYGGEFGSEPGAAALQVFQSSVYSVELAQPPPPQPRPGAMAAIPYGALSVCLPACLSVRDKLQP